MLNTINMKEFKLKEQLWLSKTRFADSCHQVGDCGDVPTNPLLQRVLTSGPEPSFSPYHCSTVNYTYCKKEWNAYGRKRKAATVP